MIDYSRTADENPTRYFAYFAGDGSWGEADDILVVDVTELDGHYGEFIEELSDNQLPDFMRWYVNNQTHDQITEDYSACLVCEQWDSGKTEDEILEDLE